MTQRYLQLPSASFVLKRLPSVFLSTTNPRPQTSLVFRLALQFRNTQLPYRPNPRPRTSPCCRCARLRKSSWLPSTPKIKLPMILLSRIVSVLRVISSATSPHFIQVLSRLPIRVSTESCQLPFDFPSSAHQIPVRTPTTGPQAFSRKEFNDHSWEVLLTHDVVNWTSTTGPLARLPTKHQILHPPLQFVPQGSAHVLPRRNQNSPYQGFWRSEVHVRRLRIRIVSQ